MKYFAHPINPHVCAVSADTFFEGWHYGVWDRSHPAVDPSHYEYQSRNLEAAQSLCAELEQRTAHLRGEDTDYSYRIPDGVAPHSMAAASVLSAAAST